MCLSYWRMHRTPQLGFTCKPCDPLVLYLIIKCRYKLFLFFVLQALIIFVYCHKKKVFLYVCPPFHCIYSMQFPTRTLQSLYIPAHFSALQEFVHVNMCTGHELLSMPRSWGVYFTAPVHELCWWSTRGHVHERCVTTCKGQTRQICDSPC